MKKKEHTSYFKLPWSGSIWLFLELVVISVVAWVVFDPAVVNLYYRSLSLGYDASRLVHGEYITREEAEDEYIRDEYGYLMEYISRYQMNERRQDQIIRQLMDVEGVESVTINEGKYEQHTIGYPVAGGFTGCVNGKDTTALTEINFYPNTHFFETFDLRPLPGSPSAEELSLITAPENKVILTRSGAINVFGTDDVVGRHFKIRRHTYDYKEMIYDEKTVAGVVEDFRKSVPSTLHSILISPDTLKNSTFAFAIRLREGVNARRFVEEHGAEVVRKGNTNYNRICQLMTFQEHLQKQEVDAGRTQEMNRSLILALFFLVSLCLGVIGTVWLQAKRHTEECGVRRAFGATRPRLLREMLWQNALLATIAVVVGLIIFLNYAHSHIGEGYGYSPCEAFYSTQINYTMLDLSWVDYFWSHFLVVSAVVYIIILCTVLIGTAIPAMKIIRSKITDAIREE